MNKALEKQLEELFLQALHEPAYRAEFLEQLMNSDIYFPGSTEQTDDSQTQERYLEENSTVNIKSWPNEQYGRIIPFFTSLEKMSLAFESHENFICLSCKVFFKMTQGSLLILNPESNAIKEFTPYEIQYLLEGDYSDQSEAHEIEAETEIMLGQPKQRPDFMLDQLAKLFTQYPEVDSAFFAQSYNPASGQAPTLIIGLLFGDVLETDKMNRLHATIGQVANDCLEVKITVDLLHLDPQKSDQDIHHYLLNQTDAFYIRQKQQKKGFFAKLFS